MTDPLLFAALEFPLKLRGWFPWPLALLLAIAACAVVVVLYLRESKRVPLVVRLVLAGVRGFTLCFILFLLLRPTWVQQTTTTRYRPVAVMIDKILKGTKPVDIPVEQPMNFEFIVNLNAAKQIGLTIPPNVLVRAGKVIR